MAELDEFRLVRPLGRGGMGEVYLGHDTVLDRAVAIKLIGSRDPDEASRERFLIEARAIARLSHPNVVTIYRVGTTGDGRPFLVQELIRGKSLDQVPRPVPWREVCELAIGIARGLEAAHRRGILHRDVKPANVMVDENGIARLLAFGLAKLSVRDGRAESGPEIEAARGEPPRRGLARGSRTAGEVAETRDPRVGEVAETRDPRVGEVAETRDPRAGERCEAAGEDRVTVGESRAAVVEAPSALPVAVVETRDSLPVIGTPRYAAPEIWRGEPASVRSDLYSLGAMLYELLAAVPPCPSPDLDELQAAVLAGQVRPVDELAPEAHPALARLVMRCLALEPDARPGSAAAVAHELEAAIVGVPAVPEGNPYRGLRAFDAAHRGLFFGRGADVDVLVDRLRGEPLLVVVGDSGIGKSSVCHAGVVPAVLAGGLGDRRRWRAVSIAPGRAPWTALCDALAIDPAAGPAAGPPADELVRGLRPAAGEGLLVVIDQLEELVTLSAPAEAVRTAEALAAIAAGVPGIKALLAVRGDFLTRVAALPELGGPMTRGLHLLRVLSAADLREAVVGPARAKGVRYETEAMVDELVGAVAGNPGALPLLQFTLAELWQARDAERGVIPARALEELGGVEGGLAGHADAVLFALGAGERAAARRIVLRLVTDARTRAVRDRGELAGDDPVAAAALESLVHGRIVVARDTVEGTPSYELAHEALIRSWGTLRDWLDDAAGRHAARNRLQAGAAEWRRLERRADLLWTRRQLDEVRELDEPDDLTATERAFVEASRRRNRRRRLARAAAIAALPLIAIAIYLGVKFEAARTRAQDVAARLEDAAAHQATADRLAGEARQARTEALRLFDADADGEPRWADARRLAAEARAGYGDAAAVLEAAFVVDAGAVRAPMAALLWAQAELAEAEHDPVRVGDLLRRLSAYDPERAAGWRRPARLVIELDRPGRIAVHAFRPGAGGATIAGGFDARPVLEREGARLDEALAPGSYVAVIAMPDGHVVRDPVWLARGERLVRSMAVPPRSAVPPGFVYVPAGRFLFGSARDEVFRRESLLAPPLHAASTGAFWISRTEVTFADWMAYLRDLRPAERATREPSNGVTLEERDGRFTLSIEMTTNNVLRAGEGEPLVYAERTVRRSVGWERLPVVGVSYRDGLAYTAWLDRTGRVRGARTCTVREWERAARGADGRSYPHGDTLRATEANVDETYGRKTLAYGLDEVGSFSASDSPFGVSDLAGNVWEATTGGGGGLRYKGGSFFQTRLAALSSNAANPGEPTQRNVRIGLRVCADAARAR